MKTATRRTALCAVVLAVLAAGAPFLCLIPLFAPAGAGDTADTSEPAPAAQTPAPSPAVSRAPGAQPAAILLWDEAAGQALSVSAKEYLMGAAACEMPIDWPDDALQAQMVASHSYALYQLAHNESSGAALSVNSAQCSGWTTRAVLESRWGDSFAENWQRLSDLAEEVLFDLVLYQGEPAACYHAISSGHTQASQRVWQESLPYLQGVDSPWDKYAQDYEVTVQYTSQQVSDCLYSALGIHVSGDPSTWVGDTVWDDAGYVDNITLCGQTVSGTDLRSALSLRSACFALSWQEDHFAVTTRGYGHGVGLSQGGARAMAAGGSSWQDILLYYFPSTQIGQES